MFSGWLPSLFYSLVLVRAFQVALVVKNLPANAGDLRDEGSIPGLGRSPGEGHGNPIQYSCLENLMDRGACGVCGVAKSWTRLSDLYFHFPLIQYNYHNQIHRDKESRMVFARV